MFCLPDLNSPPPKCRKCDLSMVQTRGSIQVPGCYVIVLTTLLEWFLIQVLGCWKAVSINRQSSVASDQLRIEILNYFQKPQVISVLLLIFDFPEMTKVKLGTGIIKPFSSDRDVVVWLRKILLVVRLQKTDDVASLFPLYLEEDGFQLYLEMDKDQLMNINLIESRLKEAFLDGEFSAYTKLKLVR